MASTDSLEDNTGFAEKNGASFPILADPEKEMSRAFGVLMAIGFAKRWTYYIDPEGVIAKIDKQVDPLTAGATLVSTLRELGVPTADEQPTGDAPLAPELLSGD